MPDRIKIRVMLCGGLGNQLFQYAFGRALALRSGADLELDAATIFQYDRKYRRKYGLDVFSIPPEITVIRRPERGWRLKRNVIKVLERTRPIQERSFVEEPRPLGLVPEFLNWKTTRSVCLHGYWQCPQYFEEARDQLLQDLAFSESLSRGYQILADEICNTLSVAVHVRRVQYNRKMDKKYFVEGVSRMREIRPDSQFFVFSDDPDWWKESFDPLPDTKLVEPFAGYSDVHDFHIMTLCRNFIISASSFSWWTAWLGNADGKLVFAPNCRNWSHPDTVPSSWKSLK